MKNLILILLLPLSFLPKSNSSDKTLFIFGSVPEKLSGSVKQIIEVSTDHLGQHEPSRTITEFDKNGDINQVQIGPLKGESQIMKFNTNYGSNAERTTTIGSSLVIKMIYIYDNSGRVAKVILKNEFAKDSPGTVTEYKYDGNDDVAEIDILDSSGKVSVKEVFNYDEKHRLTAMATIVKDQPALKTHYQYLSFDQKDNWIKKVSIEEGIKDTITRKITYY